ncbi:hypothetical protein [Helicobacter sp. 23-1045]
MSERNEQKTLFGFCDLLPAEDFLFIPPPLRRGIRGWVKNHRFCERHEL